MNIFQIREDLTRTKTGNIDAAHKWELPGVNCPVCNSIWSTTGLEYPATDLTNFIDEKTYRKPGCVRLSKYLDLKNKIADAFPQIPLLKPGTEFGPLVGKAGKRRLDGFVWNSWWSICLEATALEKLKNRRVKLPFAVKAEIKFKGEPQEIFEFDLPLGSKLLNGVYDGIQLEYCEACGRDSATMPPHILLERASIPGNIDIFRVSNFSTIIAVTENFAGAVADAGIKGCVFEEVEAV